MKRSAHAVWTLVAVLSVGVLLLVDPFAWLGEERAPEPFAPSTPAPDGAARNPGNAPRAFAGAPVAAPGPPQAARRPREAGLPPFRPAAMIRGAGKQRVPNSPPGVTARGSGVVRWDPSLNPLRDCLLADLSIVSPPVGKGDAEEYFKAPARVVSLDGHLLRDHVVISGGALRRGTALLLRRSKRIEGLRQEAARLRKSLEKAAANQGRLTSIFQETEEEFGGLTRRSTEESEDLKKKAMSLADLDRKTSILRGEVLQLEEELREVSAAFHTRQRESKELRERLESAEREMK